MMRMMMMMVIMRNYLLYMWYFISFSFSFSLYLFVHFFTPIFHSRFCLMMIISHSLHLMNTPLAFEYLTLQAYTCTQAHAHKHYRSPNIISLSLSELTHLHIDIFYNIKNSKLLQNDVFVVIGTHTLKLKLDKLNIFIFNKSINQSDL